MNTLISSAIVITVIIAVFQNYKNKKRKIQKLKAAYEQSLKGSNKKTALDAGRAYYSILRKDKLLTSYDEQAITNDLAAMNVEIINADSAIHQS